MKIKTLSFLHKSHKTVNSSRQTIRGKKKLRITRKTHSCKIDKDVTDLVHISRGKLSGGFKTVGFGFQEVETNNLFK
ncbi:CLUMA_CG014782, isoform A [Clunio marinus]|uniref:CLUMA_CG014782, isoform A n=1 Tax=Clunio marinus TaxID=568069 RepID=A0A1J1ILY5_9DIPT|nr:CLUMA_CG014782, isoform A [Clunio marinus]